MFWMKKVMITELSKWKNRRRAQICRGVYTDLQTFYEGMNFVSPNASVEKSYLGYATYVGANTNISKTKIGRFSCIGPNVRIICGQHPLDFVSIHPAFFSLAKQAGFTFVKKNKFNEYRYIDNKYQVEIGNDVWIGDGAGIMEGVVIGDGAVIAAGALVVKNVRPYEIVGGIPAKKIKSRFEKRIVERLLQLSWWNKDLQWIENHAELFENVERFLSEAEGEEEHS